MIHADSVRAWEAETASFQERIKALMTTRPQRVDDLLRRKQQLDRQNEQSNNMTSYDRWLADAIEVLLRMGIDRKEFGDEQGC
jgi:hypothetical protein